MRPPSVGSRGRRSRIAFSEIAVVLVYAETPARPPCVIVVVVYFGPPVPPGGCTFGVFLWAGEGGPMPCRALALAVIDVVQDAEAREADQTNAYDISSFLNEHQSLLQKVDPYDPEAVNECGKDYCAEEAQWQ